MKVEFTFSVGISLTYQLNDSQTAAKWLEDLTRFSHEDLNKTGFNHRHGFANYQEVAQRIDDLKVLAEKLGLQFKGYDHKSLNQLHVEFPKFHQRWNDPATMKIANELNLLIHWLEYELCGCELFNLDFNDAAKKWQHIPEVELKYFCTDYTFGDLHLHYVHVGRPLFEMFLNEDRSTPPSQFRPQHYFNATCGLVFREARTDEEKLRSYFNSLGGKAFFGFAYDDPLLAKGYFKLGQLQGFETLEEREDLRSRLAEATVVSWRAC